MSRPTPETQSSHPTQRGLIGRALHRMLQILIWLFIALVFSVIVEWVGMIFFWPEEGPAHSQEMLENEIEYINKDFYDSVIVSTPAKFARDVADVFYVFMFEKTRFVDFIRWLEEPPTPADSKAKDWFRALYKPFSDFIFAGMTISQVFALRIAVLILAMPAFAIFMLVGITDGLVERDLRRWQGGTESSFVYHWAKKPIIPVLLITWFVYLSMPVSVHPNFVILPFAALFGLLVAITASKFKKYL